MLMNVMEITKLTFILQVILNTALADCESEDGIIQTCYFCTIVGYDDEITVSSQAECLLNLTDSYKSATYDKSAGTCRLSDSSEEQLTVTTDERITYRRTCNTDCNIFSATRQAFTEVNEDTYLESDTENCFLLCTETPDCQMVYYSFFGSTCRIYTTCGTSCDTLSPVLWSGTTFWRYCYGTAQDCGFDTSDVTGVDLVYNGTTYTGSIVTYTCEYPYIKANTNQHTCQANGSWTNEDFVCNVPDCGPPDNISSGSGNVTYVNTTWTSVANYTCNVGYELQRLSYGGWGIGDSSWGTFSGEVTCEASGSWSISVNKLRCSLKDCGDPGELLHGDEIKTTFTYGSVVSFYCYTGYEISANTTLECNADGNWEGVFPSCIIEDCGQPMSIANGNEHYTLTTYGEVVRYTCNSGLGYELVGSDTLTCGADGIWMGTVPSCSLVDCGTLSAPNNGSIVISSTIFNSVATFECEIGFDMIGSQVRGCEFNGWNGSQPICNPKDCGYLSAPENGSITLFGTTYGFEATYHCIAGFDLNGTASRRCLFDGNWNLSAPLCEPKDCGLLQDPQNGSMHALGTTYGFTANYLCDTGFYLNGTSSRQCLSNGSWSSTSPICDLINCGSLSAPGNGSVIIPGTTFGFEATYLCDTGFNLNGTATRQCLSGGNWNSTAPICEPIECGPLQAPDNGSIHIQGTTYGFEAIYSCDVGFNLNGYAPSKCLSVGTWNSTAPICDPMDCGSLQAPSNGSIQYQNTTFNFIASYVCDTGFDLNGTTSRQCLSDGTWSSTTPVCQPKDCGQLSAPANGSILVSETTYGFLISYKCNEGFILNGTASRQCLSDGTWNSSAPVCDQIDCGPLSVPGNGSILVPGTTFGFEVAYNCDIGYDLNGTAFRQCLSDGNWNSTAPQCYPKNCGQLSAPANGSIQVQGTTFGFEVVYLCDTGYNLNGTFSRQCLSDGTWNSSAPVCDPKDCGQLPVPGNGSLHVSGTTFGFTATYMCNSGFYLNGTAIRQCLADGTWNATAPICDRRDCGILSEPENGSILGNDTAFGSNVTYVCNIGYDLNGTATRKCLSTGNWSAADPFCYVKDCGPLDQPSNGTVSCSNGTTYLSVAIYGCFSGYNLIGSSARKCESNGQWGGTSPQCTYTDCGALTSPTNGHVTMSGGTGYNALATYSCTTGYILQGIASRRCQISSKWTGTKPLCVLEGYAPKMKSIFIAPCICYRNKTFTNMTQEEIISYLIAQTAIDVTNTSSARSKLMCASDQRTSAATLGMMGAGLLAFVCVLILGIDSLRIWKYLSTKLDWKQNKYLQEDKQVDEEKESDK